MSAGLSYGTPNTPIMVKRGKHDPVSTEWKQVEILSNFNAWLDADALGLGAMANASFFAHFPLQRNIRLPNRPLPT